MVRTEKSAASLTFALHACLICADESPVAFGVSDRTVSSACVDGLNLGILSPSLPPLSSPLASCGIIGRMTSHAKHQPSAASNTIYVIAMKPKAMLETPDMAVDRVAWLRKWLKGCDIPDSELRPKNLIRPQCRLVLGDISTAPPTADGESVYASLLLPADGAAKRLFSRHSEDMKDSPFAETYGTDDPDTYLKSAEDMTCTLDNYLRHTPDEDYILRESFTSGDGSRRGRVTSRLSIY